MFPSFYTSRNTYSTERDLAAGMGTEPSDGIVISGIKDAGPAHLPDQYDGS